MAAPPPTAPADDTSPPASLSAQLKDLDSRFWIVNTMEMFERLAYYGVRTVVPLYMVLAREEGGPELSHEQKGVIFAWWAGMQSVLPMFTGGYADRYGHKQTIAAAIVLKIIGYLMMAELKTYEGFFAGCMLLAAGTAIFKPGVQGTLAATLKKSSASVGWGVFYQLVNVGGFIGPVLAGVLRLMDWRYVFWSCAVIVAINFLWLPFYRDSTQDAAHDPNPPSPLQVLITSVTGLFRPRVFFFCVVFSGFWLMFNQVFDLLPNMIDDWVDSSDLIKTVGAAFSTSAVPIALAVALGALWGGVCWAVSWLGTRPDHHPPPR
jgi:POT family proton-dependent oligopeptide transporter